MKKLLCSLLTATLFASSSAQADQTRHGQVEHLIQSKRGSEHQDLCEDGLFYNDRFLVVVDGASDKTGRRYHGHTGGWHCKESVLRVFRRLQGGEEPVEIVKEINRELGELYSKFGIDPKASPELRFSSVLIWYDFKRKGLYAIGDCKARVDGELFNHEEKLVDRLNSQVRAEVLNALEIDLSRPLPTDPGRDYITPLLKGQSRYQNNPQAPQALQYWVIDGTAVPADKIVTRSFAHTPGVIELSSDGYAEFPATASIEAYEEELRSLLREDPNLAVRVKSTKGVREGNASFDDRTILIFQKP